MIDKRWMIKYCKSYMKDAQVKISYRIFGWGGEEMLTLWTEHVWCSFTISESIMQMIKFCLESQL